MPEQRKQNVAKEYIETNILNKEFVEIQKFFWWELNDLKKEIESLTNILWSEKPVNTNEEKENFLLKNIMNTFFNKTWKQRSWVWFDLIKSINPVYNMISEEWKLKLDLLFESLHKAKSEQEVRDSLNVELNNLQNNIVNDWDNWNNINNWNNMNNLWNLTEQENEEMQDLIEKSQNLNDIKYLENPTYKKYLNIIERDLNLPKYTLECVCYQESKWLLYKNWHIIWSHAWAQWLFQFMPDTANQYMKHSKLNEKYWKTFSSRDEFLKDPLASAWASWIMFSEFMHKYHYNLQTSLACYNWGIWNYQNNIWKRNLTQWDLWKLNRETRNYVTNISKDILKHNWVLSEDVFVDLWKYTWDNTWNVDVNPWARRVEIWNVELLAKKRSQLWWIGSSVMNWFSSKSFVNMHWINSATTTNKQRFEEKGDELYYNWVELWKYCKDNWIKSFMFYFGWNESAGSEQAVNKAYQNIEQWSNYLQSKWIQPVLCTCLYEDIVNHSVWHKWEVFPLHWFNQNIRNLWKQKGWPVIDFAEIQDDIPISPDKLHPTPQWYKMMREIIDKKIWIS